MTKRYDVCVVGAGMVGATFAALLARSKPKLRIAILDRVVPDPFDANQDVDLRVSALGRSSQRILKACDVWDEVSRTRSCNYRRMQVWDASQKPTEGLSFDCADIGEPDLGAIVENRLVQALLLRQIRGSANIDCIMPATPESIELEGNTRHLVLQDGRSFDTSLIIAADGARSKIRELAEIEVQGWTYGQQGVVAILRTEAEHQFTAWQRFLSDGVIAFLPLADGRCSSVWSCAETQAQELLALEEDDFNKAVGAALGGALGLVVESGKRASFPLSLMHARNYVTQGLALIGDAAHVVHPLAGQGANLGFLDAAVLVEVINNALGGKMAYYDFNVLRRYERWRKGENLLMMSALDGIKRLFGAGSLTGLRAGGLTWIDQVRPVKDRLIRHAMGLSGDLPAVVRN